MVITGLAEVLVERMRAQHTDLAARWFECLRTRLPVEACEVFPTSSLLDHIPDLIVEISAYLRAPEDVAFVANTAVVEKARELGALRHEQRASLHQVLREYQLLSDVLVDFIRDEMAKLTLVPSPPECVAVVARLHHAVNILTQETVETFVGLYTRTISGQAERLEQFTRMATHEWRQPLGALQFAVSLLRRADIEPPQMERTLELMDRNVAHLSRTTHKLERLARMHASDDDVTVQEVSLGTVAVEAVRQLQEMADAREVMVRVADNLPTVVVDIGRLELALVNLLSNAIKYSDGQKAERIVEVSCGSITSGECQVIVRDNGIGIPPEQIGKVFDRFSRAHADRESIAGLGLGLSIVADCVKTIGGQIAVESTEREGTTFVLTLPLRPSGESASPQPAAGATA